MTDNVYAATTSTSIYSEARSTETTQTFYVVSVKKAVLLFFFTLSLYSVYWFYKHWACYKKVVHTGSSFDPLWAALRGFFSVFFVHALYREIKAAAGDNPAVERWNVSTHAWLTVVLLLLSSGLSRASSRSIGSPVTDILSGLILLPLVAALMKAQKMANMVCGDPTGASNSRLTVANYVWIVLGSIWWALMIFGWVTSR